MLYSIDYVEQKDGFQIVRDLEMKIDELKADFRYGNITYDEMLYRIGEEAKLVGCALSTEHRYADKEENGDSYFDDIDNNFLVDWIFEN